MSMKKTLHTLFAISFVFLISSFVSAQQNASVSGKVTAEGKPVEAASLSLLKIKDSSVVKIEITDKQGKYEFDNIKTGNYFVQANVVGYKKVSTAAFEVSNVNSTIQLDEIKLSEELKEL